MVGKKLIGKKLENYEEVILWKDISNVRYSQVSGVSVKSSTGNQINVSEMILDYKKAWRDIIVQISKNAPSTEIPEKLIHLLATTN